MQPLASPPPLGSGSDMLIAIDPLDPLQMLIVSKDYGLSANGDCRPNGAFSVASVSYVMHDGGLTWTAAKCVGDNLVPLRR